MSENILLPITHNPPPPKKKEKRSSSLETSETYVFQRFKEYFLKMNATAF